MSKHVTNRSCPIGATPYWLDDISLSRFSMPALLWNRIIPEVLVLLEQGPIFYSLSFLLSLCLHLWRITGTMLQAGIDALLQVCPDGQHICICFNVPSKSFLGYTYARKLCVLHLKFKFSGHTKYMAGSQCSHSIKPSSENQNFPLSLILMPNLFRRPWNSFRTQSDS